MSDDIQWLDQRDPDRPKNFGVPNYDPNFKPEVTACSYGVHDFVLDESSASMQSMHLHVCSRCRAAYNGLGPGPCGWCHKSSEEREMDGIDTERRLPSDLRNGDIITDGNGIYRVWTVNEYQVAPVGQVWHIRVTPVAGRVVGALMRSSYEYVTVMLRRDY